MSEDLASPGGTPQGSGGTEAEKANQNPDNKTVSYESFQKLLDEKKRLQAEVEASKAQKLEDLKSTGKFEELYKTELQERQKLESALKLKEATYTLETANAAFESAALKAGCQKPEHLRKLVGDTELAKVVGQNFRPDADALSKLIETSQKEFDYLFDKAAPKFRDGAPNPTKQDASKDIGQMNSAELVALLKRKI